MKQKQILHNNDHLAALLWTNHHISVCSDLLGTTGIVGGGGAEGGQRVSKRRFNQELSGLFDGFNNSLPKALGSI